MSYMQVLELFEECDDDQSGVLEFPEFVSLLMMVHKKVLTLAERKGLRDKSRIRKQEVVYEMKALQLVHQTVNRPAPFLFFFFSNLMGLQFMFCYFSRLFVACLFFHHF